MQQVNFPASLKLLREHLDLTQTEMGKMLGISRNLVSMMEREEDPTKPSKTVKLLFDQMWEKAFQPGTSVTGARARLKEARLQKGLSQKEVADAVGYPLATYQSIEEGMARMGRKQANKLATLLQIDVNELLDGSDHPPAKGGMHGSFGEIPDIDVPPGMTVKYVPLISMAECGPLVAWDDGAYTGEGFAVFDGKDPKAFALRLSGDSMTPVYSPGDVAVVYPSHQPRNGDVVIARLDDDHGADVMFKLFQSSADTVTLTSYNPAYAPIQWPRSAFTWIYPVAQVTKTLRKM